MTLVELRIPCAECLAALEAELVTVPDVLASGRSVFCPHRAVALTVGLQLGRVAWWQVWPAASAAEAQQYLVRQESALILGAAPHSARAARH